MHDCASSSFLIRYSMTCSQVRSPATLVRQQTWSPAPVSSSCLATWTPPAMSADCSSKATNRFMVLQSKPFMETLLRAHRRYRPQCQHFSLFCNSTLHHSSISLLPIELFILVRPVILCGHLRIRRIFKDQAHQREKTSLTFAGVIISNVLHCVPHNLG